MGLQAKMTTARRSQKGRIFNGVEIPVVLERSSASKGHVESGEAGEVAQAVPAVPDRGLRLDEDG
jgi:hypothetical protein